MAETRRKINKMGLGVKIWIYPTGISLIGWDLCWRLLRAERTWWTPTPSMEWVFRPAPQST